MPEVYGTSARASSGNGRGVHPDQRFTHGRSCPVCGGSDTSKRGQGERCYGYLSSDGAYAHCTRDDHAGRLPQKGRSQTYAHKLKGECGCGVEHGPEDFKPARKPGGKRSVKMGREAAVYLYETADRTPLFEVVRFADPKDFRQRRVLPDGKRTWGLGGVEPVLFRLPELNAADPKRVAFICEGEKDVLTLAGHNLIATCNAQGAGKWRDHYAESFRGRRVVILPDNDKPGRDHAEAVARSLRGVAASVKVVELPGLPEHGDVSDWFAAGGTVASLKALVEAAEAAPQGRPQIEVNTERQSVLEKTLAVLPADPDLYVRGDVLVRVVAETDDTAHLAGGVELRKAAGSARVVMVGAASLGCRVTSLAEFYSWRKDKAGEEVAVAVHPPAWLVAALAEHAEYKGVRPLRGVAGAPFPRPDGSLVTRPGYDRTTGVYLAPCGDFAVPDRPTQDDARAAAAVLLDLVGQFPFATDDDKAVFLAALLTVLARPGIRGPVPGFAVNGNRAGTGKGKLVDTIGVIGTGRPIPTTSYPRDEAEAAKVKTALALAATAVVHLDNLDEGRTYGGSSLDSALTSMVINDRILGQSRNTGALEIRCCWLLSGNNVAPTKDAFRRWLVCNLVTNLERPEERDDIKVPDLLAHVAGRRAELVTAALTVLKAHALAGRPTGGWAPLGSFEEWDKVVRGAVWFSTGLDCNATRRKAAEDAPDRLDRLALLEAWQELPGGGATGRGVTAEEAHRLATETDVIPNRPPAPKYPALADALARLSRDGKVPNVRSIGNTIRGMAGRNINGLAFHKRGEQKRSALWRVEKVYPDNPDTRAKGESGESGESDYRYSRTSRPPDDDMKAHATNGKHVGNEWREDSPDSPDSPEAGCDCFRLDCPVCNPEEF